MSKSIILCADDFGLNPGVSKGILKLVSMQRLSAVSCMVNMADFTVNGMKLIAYRNRIQIGLHFNLTAGQFLSIPGKRCFSLHSLLVKSYLSLINPSFIIDEFNAQLDRFIQVMGFMPDFIDGHQHIHQLPQVRQALFKVYKERTKGAYLRSTYPSNVLAKHQLKSKLLELLGGKEFHAQLKQQNIPSNDSFSGVYDFNSKSNYRSLFRQWLAQADNNTLIMCHPGEEYSSKDAIRVARTKELEYFLSEGFQSDCREYAIHLAGGPVSR